MARYGTLSPANHSGQASFKECSHGPLAAALDTVINAGDLISFSRTRDGGAICLYIKSGAEDFRTYCVTGADLDEALLTLSRIG